MSLSLLVEALRKVEAACSADVFVYAGPIDQSGFRKLFEAVAASEPGEARNNCILIVKTYGGLAQSAYQIAKLLNGLYEKFTVYVPAECKSAGTLVCLGAHELIMDVFSELGPLDVQLLAKDEIGSRKSGLQVSSALEALSNEAFKLYSKTMLGIIASSDSQISFRLASEIASKMTTELLVPVFAQIDPDVIGSDFRDLQIATEYGVRLSKVGRNCKEGAINKLVEGYPSHDFIIDYDEAVELFQRVTRPSQELNDLAALLTMRSDQQFVFGRAQLEAASSVRSSSAATQPMGNSEGAGG
jgi:hypothetical protein